MNQQYRDYLKSDLWFDKVRKVIERDRCCRVCDSKNRLTVHHLTYQNVFRESLEELMTLCWTCHKQLHQIAKNKKCDISTALSLLRSDKIFIKRCHKKQSPKKIKIFSEKEKRQRNGSNGDDYKNFIERKKQIDDTWKMLHPKKKNKKQRPKPVIDVRNVLKVWNSK